LGHLSFRHWRSEIERDTILNYISTLVIQRKIQRNAVPKSRSGMSSEYSTSPKKVRSQVALTPRVRELSLKELSEATNLSPKERKARFTEAPS
jgi:hypothetical protein